MSEKLFLKKTKIRQDILKRRLAFTESERRIAEIKMLSHLINWNLFKCAKSIHIFISKKDEPKTRQIIEFCWKSGKEISVPYVLQKENELFHSKLISFSDLGSETFGVLEPSPEKRIETEPENFDIVVVPGIAFDHFGGRIGYGKGFYDKFLPKTNAFRLALAFDFQVLENVPTELHDATMHGILSESGIFIMGK